MKFHPRSSLCTAVTALGLTTSVFGFAATQPESLATILVAPAALIVEGSSTNQSGAGIADFFGGMFKPTDGTETVVLPFSAGAPGIVQALKDHPNEHNVVLSSGWGAANATVALSGLAANHDPVLGNTVWVLDNNVVTPNGGFGTRYPVFSSIVGVPTGPTPTNTGVPVINIAYVYDINSNAPRYVLNVFADVNTVVAYFERRLTPQNLQLPVDANGTPRCPGGATSCTVTVSDGTPGGIVAHLKQVGSTTYVTYDPPNGLPLVAPLRSFGDLGNKLADVLEPALTALVNWGYPNNDPIGDPNAAQRARLFPSLGEDVQFLQNFVAGVGAGIAALGAPTSSVSVPAPKHQNVSMAAASVPQNAPSSATTSSVTTTSTVTAPVVDSPKLAITLASDLPKPQSNVVKNGNKSTPGQTEPDKGTTGGPNFIESAVKAVSDGLLKPTATPHTTTSSPSTDSSASGAGTPSAGSASP
jgi:hypothetical protein